MTAAEQTDTAARRRRPLVLVAIAVVLLAGTTSWVFWPSQPEAEPEPPTPKLVGVDPDIVRAIGQAQAAVRKAPRSAQTWGRLGMVLRAHDFGAEADTCFERAEGLDGNDPRWPYLRGATLALSDRDGAIPFLERAAERAGSNPAPRLRLAETLLLQGRSDEAEQHFRQTWEASPEDPRAALGLARLALKRGELNASLEFLKPALASPLSGKAAHMLEAEILHRLGESETARMALRRAAERPADPPWPDPFVEEVERLQVGVQARLSLADQLSRQGRGPDALALLEEMIEEAPDSESAQFLRGQVFLRSGQFAKAEESFRRVMALAPGSVETHFQLGNALFFQNEYGPAAESFRQSIRLKPAHGLAHYNLGHCLLKAGDPVAALAAFREALRFQPDYAPAHVNAADLLSKMGKDAEAMEHLDRAVRLAPADARAKDLLETIRSRRPVGSKEKRARHAIP